MNSRPQISNHQELVECIRRLTRHAQEHGTRAIVLLDAPSQEWLAEFAGLQGVDYLSVQSATDRADRIASLLGSERSKAAIQLGPTPDHGLLAALTGSIRAGGIVIIATAAPPDTVTFEDIPSHAAPFPRQSYATQRLIRLARDCADTFPRQVLCAHVDNKDHSNPAHQASPSAHDNTLRDLSGPTRYLNPQAKIEQDALFDNACGHLETHARTCIVIKGRRGRGKSTLLARIARHLQLNNETFSITAMHSSALDTCRQYSDALALHYVSPESVEHQHIQTLFVDEASSFSLHRLQAYSQNCQRLVICTTVEGYEASGRAFEIRLLPELAKSYSALLALEPAEPWRWASDDPLEKFTDALLIAPPARPSVGAALTTPATTFSHLPDNLPAHCCVVHIAQHELACNESLLTQVHALLSTTHYQSSARDLEHLLDAPSVQLWTQQFEQTVVAVLLLELEGCIDAQLHEPIVYKQRRLPNQLLPQLLAQSANRTDALSRCYARVLRITVQPELRRRQLATSLLESVSRQLALPDQQAKPDLRVPPIDAMGASFAADERSLAFWKSLGYTEFHRGYRANPRTGKHAVAVMKSFEQATSAVLKTAAGIHQANQLARKQGTDYANASAAGALQTQDVALLSRFADGQRSVNDTYAALCRLNQVHAIPLSKSLTQSQRSYELELRHSVQQWILQYNRSQMLGA